MPLIWGKTDCGLTAADAIFAMTGDDPAACLRNRYDDAGGALRALRRAGFRRVRDMVAAQFIKAATNAQTGDLVLVSIDPLDLLMIAHDSRLAWGQDETGLTLTPIPDNAEIWSV